MAAKKKTDSVPPPPAEAITQAQGASDIVPFEDDDEWDFGEDARQGFKGLTRDEFSIPFYGLLQSNSDIVKGKEIPGAEGGLFLNALSKELTPKLIVQPVYIDRVIVEWAPRGTDKKVVGRYKYTDPVVQQAMERNGGSIIGTKERPLYSGNDKNTLRDTRYLYFQRLAEDGLSVIGFGIFGFSGTKIRKLVDATSAIDQSGFKCPMWSGRFVIESFLDDQKGEKFHNVTIVAFGRTNLMFDKSNLLPKPPRNPDAEWTAKHKLYESGRQLQESIVGGVHKADYDTEHVAGEESGEAAQRRHF